jgi:hypothetical protein
MFQKKVSLGFIEPIPMFPGIDAAVSQGALTTLYAFPMEEETFAHKKGQTNLTSFLTY